MFLGLMGKKQQYLEYVTLRSEKVKTIFHFFLRRYFNNETKKKMVAAPIYKKKRLLCVLINVPTSHTSDMTSGD